MRKLTRRGLVAGWVSACFASLAIGQTPIKPRVVSYFGGNGNDRVEDVIIGPGANGKVYFCGNTHSPDLNDPGVYPLITGVDKFHGGPMPNPPTTTAWGDDGFVAIASRDLSTLESWTYMGGNSTDRAYAVRLDGAGNVFVYGFTESQNFKTGGLKGTRDVFVIKYNPDLSQELWRETYGGPGTDCPDGQEQGRDSMFVDASGFAYISGGTDCSMFPGFGTTPIVAHTPAGTTATNPGNFDAYVVKIDGTSTGTGGVVWNTFFGGVGDESAYSGLDLDSAGNIYVGGATNLNILNSSPPANYTNGIPTPNGYQQVYQGGLHAQPNALGFYHHIVLGDGFVAKFSPAGALTWATYLGGSETDSVSGNDGLVVTADGFVHVIGSSRSPNFLLSQSGPCPTSLLPVSYSRVHLGSNQSDGFVAVLSQSGSCVDWWTFIGGHAEDELGGVDLDGQGNIYFGGGTMSLDYPTTSNAYKPTPNNVSEALLTKMDPFLSTLLYSTYVGGSGTMDRGRALDFVRTNRLTAIGGDTDSDAPSFIPSGLPVTGFDQARHLTSRDGFVMIFSLP